MTNFDTTFGVVVCTSPNDYLFAKGTCASIHYFMPDVSIALLVDGNVDTKSLEQTYRVKVIRKHDINDPWLRQYSFGWGITKMLAFWYAPFERFLYLDSDTVIWGNIVNKLNLKNYDYITDIPFHGDKILTPDYVGTWFFEPSVIDTEFSEFPWRNYIHQYACTGTFVTGRGVFDVQEYRELLEFNERYPWTFKFGEMGLLNLMVFRAHDQKKIKLGFADFQVIFPDFQIEELRSRFQFKNNAPVVQADDIQVLHMPDKKPLVNSPHCYSLPMTYFRLKFLKDALGIIGDEAMTRLLQEDQEYHQLRKQSLKLSRISKIKMLVTGHPGEWRRLIRRVCKLFT